MARTNKIVETKLTFSKEGSNPSYWNTDVVVTYSRNRTPRFFSIANLPFGETELTAGLVVNMYYRSISGANSTGNLLVTPKLDCERSYFIIKGIPFLTSSLLDLRGYQREIYEKIGIETSNPIAGLKILTEGCQIIYQYELDAKEWKYWSLRTPISKRALNFFKQEAKEILAKSNLKLIVDLGPWGRVWEDVEAGLFRASTWVLPTLETYNTVQDALLSLRHVWIYRHRFLVVGESHVVLLSSALATGPHILENSIYEYCYGELPHDKHFLTDGDLKHAVIRILQKCRSEKASRRLVKAALSCDDLLITVEDSLDSGNCLTGTNDFRSKYNLKSESYTLRELKSHPKWNEMLGNQLFKNTISYSFQTHRPEEVDDEGEEAINLEDFAPDDEGEVEINLEDYFAPDED